MNVDVRREQILAYRSLFLIQGVATGVWLAHIPSIVARLALIPSLLGILLALAYGGGILGSAVLGALIPRIGEQQALKASLSLYLMVVVVTILTPSIRVLSLALLCMGFLAGAFNTTLNASAAAFEHREGNHLMAGFHGFYSVGAAIGAAAGAMLLYLGLEDGRGAAIVVTTLLVAGQSAGRVVHRRGAVSKVGLSRDNIRTSFKVLLPLAGIAFLGDSVEVYVNDWSGLFLIALKDMDQSTAIWGFGAFSIATAIVRFWGNWAIGRWGTRSVVTASGCLVSIGFVLSLLVSSVFLSIVSFAIVGMGTALLIPAVTTLGAQQPGVPASIGVSVISMAAHLGWILIPPAVGFVWQSFGPMATAGTMTVIGLLIALSALASRDSTSCSGAADP